MSLRESSIVRWFEDIHLFWWAFLATAAAGIATGFSIARWTHDDAQQRTVKQHSQPDYRGSISNSDGTLYCSDGPRATDRGDGVAFCPYTARTWYGLKPNTTIDDCVHLLGVHLPMARGCRVDQHQSVRAERSGGACVLVTECVAHETLMERGP